METCVIHVYMGLSPRSDLPPPKRYRPYLVVPAPSQQQAWNVAHKRCLISLGELSLSS